MLQCFGTELAETELPEDMHSIERILALRTERYCQLKVWLSRALHSHPGSLLLALLAAHSSLAPCRALCVCCQPVCELSAALCVFLPCVCRAWSTSPCQQTANCLSCQLPPACSPRCLEPAPPLGSAHLAARRAVGGSVSCGHVSSWDPLCLAPLAAESCIHSSSAGLESWFVPRSLCLVALPWGHLRELCWRASKVKISV